MTRAALAPELNEATCRWPVGDPGSTEFFFCGGPSIGSSPDCTHHSRVAYQPAVGSPPRPAEAEVQPR